jgi:hypothetical protein
MVQGHPENLIRRRLFMKLVLRKPLQQGHDCEFIFGVLFIPLLAAVFLLILYLSPHIPVFCVFHRMVGLPCPACGSFRCAELLVAGHVLQAWLIQPLATTLVFATLVYAAYSWIVVLFKLPRLRVEGIDRGQRWLMACLAVAAILANWAYIALRGV